MSSGRGGAPRLAKSSATVWPPNSGPAVDRRYDGGSSMSFSTSRPRPRRPRPRSPAARRRSDLVVVDRIGTHLLGTHGLPRSGSAAGRARTAADAAGARRSPAGRRRCHAPRRAPCIRLPRRRTRHRRRRRPRRRRPRSVSSTWPAALDGRLRRRAAPFGDVARVGRPQEWFGWFRLPRRHDR